MQTQIPVHLQFNFGQFVDFFAQLPQEYKEMMIATLQLHLQPKENEHLPQNSLLGSVLFYENPFEPVVNNYWEVIQ
jgi:hypothetical protein